MINYLKNQINKNSSLYKSFIKHNKKMFPKLDNKKKDGEILIEFNAFHSFHIPISYFANYFKNLHNTEIKAFFNYSIIAAPLKPSPLNKIKWNLGNIFSLKNFGIYRSFGTETIFRPKITNEQNRKANEKYFKLIKNIKKKKNILDIKIDEIKIGDLIYDTYLKSQMKPSVDLEDKNIYLIIHDFCKLYYFWKDYFINNNVKCIVGVHTTYAYGLPLRIAVNNGISTYSVSMRKINRISKTLPFYGGEFTNFPEIFQKLDSQMKYDGINEAKKRLQKRIAGESGIKVDLISSEVSSFHNKITKNLITQNDKIKVLIATHDFFDAVHAMGDILFTDFYEWLDFLGKISENTEYDWYIKNRPDYPGKFQNYQPHTTKTVNDLLKKYKNIKLLPGHYSHHQIIKEKINFVFTSYGTVGTEYALFDIPVINAAVNNPHHRYNFNFNPKSIEEYKNMILNLSSLNLKIDKNEIYEHYFMKQIYFTKNWLIDDLNDLIKYVGGWSGQNSFKLYAYWMSICSEQKHKNVFKTIEKFIKSDEDSININHL